MIETGQIPYVRPDESVPPVTGSWAMAEEKIERIRERRVLRCLVSRLIVERFRPRIRSQDGKPLAVTLVERDLERVVRGVEPMEEPDDSRIILASACRSSIVARFCAKCEIRIVDGRVLVVLVL